MPRKPKMYTWTVKIQVAERFIADGFDLDADRAQNMVLKELGYAREDEVIATIVKAPTPASMDKAQGDDE